MILITMTKESRIILQTISKRVAGSILINTSSSPSNILTSTPFPERIHQNSQAAFGLSES